MPGMDTSNACGKRSAPLPAFLSTVRAIKAAGGSTHAIKVTGLGVKAPYDEVNEVLSRQMHGGVELMGLAGQRVHPSRILPWSTGPCAASAEAAAPGHWTGAGAHLQDSMSRGGGGMASGSDWLGGHLALTP